MRTDPPTNVVDVLFPEPPYGGEKFVVTIDDRLSFAHAFPVPLRNRFEVSLAEFSDRICDQSFSTRDNYRCGVIEGGLRFWKSDRSDIEIEVHNVSPGFPIRVKRHKQEIAEGVLT